MTSRKILTGLLFIIFPVVLFARIDTIRLNQYYLKKYWDDSKEIVRSPVRWDQRDWQRFAVFAATTGALFFADEPVADWLQERRTGFLDKVSRKTFEPFGAEYSLVVCGVFYGYGLLAKKPKPESTALLAVESFALASLFVRIPKYLLGRQRPDSGVDVTAFDFKGPFQGTGFPSGHTIAVFSVASVIANQYRETVWVPVLSYSLAGLAGLSRIYDNRHWTSDVFAGAVMGIAIGNLVCPAHKESRISFFPVKMGPAYGVRLALSL
ncbi:MAG: phosphatase PAP2 family protein [Prolixibacteraceae bacterium]|jgi:hypothetical protein|nr:phosphatase PAP2 family protein [Prolixibacteraceae bacterium]